MNKEMITAQLKKLTVANGIEIDDETLGKAVELARFMVFPKSKIIRSIGDSANTVGIVIDGLVRSYYIDLEGNDISRGFCPEGSMCMDEGAVGYPEHICMWETLEESTLMLIEVSDLRGLIMASERLKTLWIKLLEDGLRYKMYRENAFLLENATERYLSFKKRFPGVCDRAPQKYIATCIGIMPESLSRIRRAMREE